MPISPNNVSDIDIIEENSDEVVTTTNNQLQPDTLRQDLTLRTDGQPIKFVSLTHDTVPVSPLESTKNEKVEQEEIKKKRNIFQLIKLKVVGIIWKMLAKKKSVAPIEESDLRTKKAI